MLDHLQLPCLSVLLFLERRNDRRVAAPSPVRPSPAVRHLRRGVLEGHERHLGRVELHALERAIEDRLLRPRRQLELHLGVVVVERKVTRDHRHGQRHHEHAAERARAPHQLAGQRRWRDLAVTDGRHGDE